LRCIDRTAQRAVVMKGGRFWRIVFVGVMVMLAGAELILINTILVLGNAVYYATSFERFVEGCMYYVAGAVALAVGWDLLESACRG